MYSGDCNLGFSSDRDMRVAARYSLLLSAVLAGLSLIDWLAGRSLEASLTLGVSVLSGFSAALLVLSERPWRYRWLHSGLIGAVCLLMLVLMDKQLEAVFMAYWLPFYLAFALPWKRLLAVGGVFSLLFLGRLMWTDPMLNGQVLATYLVCVAVALVFAWMNRSSQIMLAEHPVTDPLTGAYPQAQLLHDLRREVPRADRQNTRLALAVVHIPFHWRALNPDAWRNHLRVLALRLVESSLPQHALYRLDSDDLVVLMPNFRQDDADQLRSRLRYCLPGEVLDDSNLQILNYRADDDAVSLLERVCACCQSGGISR
ncbi:GGDEF domain-containing protein [Parathalassolituus penaei]|uniref:GGDEF domain-containing protein n=1 Tax=Parathalassolituus penaei TaxID=2997323 RepID=A0A9X3IRH6_9GAMM|nr:hypothetical protein [Parathalassolituus penaei]MCY0964250.1 hypothetical protein [Parathalassolituus penaei]